MQAKYRIKASKVLNTAVVFEAVDDFAYEFDFPHVINKAIER